ncbi:UDP-glucose--hexose-1-phosphate uridylyltransferase [Diplocloster agilis]|uniref:UDP-glucose--hexose-1-phosphate uridylyltransferase n=1 Tax=Diplocloster agilis TaxID=2850323 RepID=UPI000821692A|nr:UDP-glucose--hexose-1-phosphate uridylyltransferase [Suonthocola fibrivorans]MCU6736752.1 UDP-glucose--hexose-1-phosphate uridylyltransferase [Suonthocola fibrivorans]SCJ93366.1 galactose-1-phosphate uridylyltransferase [uncultured Clostridium sp.]
MLFENIKKLVKYGLETGLIEENDVIYTTNRLLELFEEADYEEPQEEYSDVELEPVLQELLDEARARGILKEDSVVYRDLFDTKIMGCLAPRPSEFQKKFWALYEEDPRKATDYFYKFSQDTDYIRRYRICKDMRWKVDSEYGSMDITINLSKPEKDPKAIAAAKLAKASGYPKCLLCKENEGYMGRVNHPARQNHRIVPVTIQGGAWGFQYSPYVYYNEHCIVFNGEHIPMKIDRTAFAKLFDFIKLFPHYFIGSNADLPIVGGSILSHDHFQGGNYEFAMARAAIEEQITIPGYEDVEAGILHWPLSVIRIRHKDSGRLVELADYILGKWRAYTDEEAFIYAETNGEPHNTITPIARQKDGVYELDLTLRNNITTEEHPFGVYHPHADLHHIKKENIGLIEVMGLAVLPARLKDEMENLASAILTGKEIRADEELAKHADWVEEFLPRHPELNKENIHSILQQEIGQVFVKVLEDAGVFKCDPAGREAFRRFTAGL